MATTVNGHPVIETARTTGSLPRLRKWVIPGTGRHFLLRDGAMGFVLAHILLWFHEAVERLDLDGQPWDEWGWAKRPVRGSTSGFSNHAGGVAADANATLHPLGVPISITFTDRQIRAIKLRLQFYRGLVIWGGLWRRPDGMHFECASASLARFERLARFLMKTPRGRRILAANPGAKEAILS